MIIDNFKEKKLIEYLQPGQKVLIKFGHGLGDTLMFMPLFFHLRTLYPKNQIDIYLECGQEDIFASVRSKDGEGYDLIFSLNFPMSEHTGLTKVAKCCIDEIGIKLPSKLDEVAPLALRRSPFVVVHFQGTALPGSVNCPEGIAHQIWSEIIEAGKIPLECHFKHCFHNPVNKKYLFINRDVRDCKADINSLIALIQYSFAFIGVASGPFIVALSCLPQRIMYIEKNHPLETYTKEDIPKIDVNNYQQGQVKKWLQSL